MLLLTLVTGFTPACERGPQAPQRPAGNTAVSSAAGASSAAEAPEPVQRPNVLVFMVDTLRADDLGCYGSTSTKTPAIDRFAAEGVLFLNANSVSSSTRQSVASFITGVVPYVHGAEGRQRGLAVDSAALVRLPEQMQKAGYYTGGIVANPNIAAHFGFNKGFDVYHELYDPPPRHGHPLISDAPVVVAKVKEFVEQAPADKPFFLYVLSIDPHAPYTPPPPYDTMYDPQAVGRRDGSMRALREFAWALESGDVSGAARIRALYRGEISYTDEHFGDLLAWLRERGTLDDTLVVLTSDHGESFGEHGLRGHGNAVYEDTTYVPMILRYPRAFKMGVRRTERVDTLDLAATVLLAAGMQPPAFWLGRDLRGPLAPRPIFSTMRKTGMKGGQDHAAVRQNGWKMVVNKLTSVTEYFYLPDDPQEQNPLRGEKKEQAQVLLASKLADFYKITEAQREQLLGGAAESEEETIPERLKRTLRSLGYVP